MADKIVGVEALPSGTGIPVRFVDQGDGTFALKIATTGGGGGGGAATVADGADVAEGAIADAAVTAGAAGTISAKLRSISRDQATQITAEQATANGIGTTADAAVTAGAVGTVLAKLRSISRDLIANIVLAAGENIIGKTAGIVATPSTTVTRPANTTAYVVGQLVANSTTAGSVTALQFTASRLAAGSATIRRGRLSKTSTSTTNAAFRLHLFSASPLAPTNGDGGAFVPVGAANYLGALDVTSMIACTDGAAGNGAPLIGSDITFALSSGTTIYGLLEARGAYTPTSSEVFTAYLEIFQN
jgi:hypothetical protein